MSIYSHKKIEKKWQKYWEEHELFRARDDSPKPKLYTLIEFPYPSGEGLHVGHPRPYTAMDIISRKKRMDGYNVLYPIGWDAFGLPTENYAIKTGQPPAKVTKKNIANFTRQIKSLGISFDWSREVNTTDPAYYKWTQWIFLQLFKHGLAYKSKIAINWCINCKIGLANEEVVGGVCERCGGPVEKRLKDQWMLAITKYADKLLEGLKEVNYIPQAQTQQENWIGRSEGAEIDFKIQGSGRNIRVFTTRPDTLFGATYMVLAPEHELVGQLSESISNLKDVEEYIAQAKRKSDLERTELQKEKTGVELCDVRAINPANNEEIPVWVADYVLGGYGTGAIMAVPAHDERDWGFAKKYGLKIYPVVLPYGGSTTFGNSMVQVRKEVVNKIIDVQPFIREGFNIESKFLNGLKTAEAKIKMIQWLEKEKIGACKIQYKLRDWVFSRQRYWGEPIPLVFCEACAKFHKGESVGEQTNPGWIPLPESELPLKLPAVKKYEPTDTGESPLSAMSKWVNTKCPRCGGAARRETDTMPNWAGSSWYFLRYIDPRNDKEFASMDALKQWMPVDWYNGGMEHTVLHLLYSRFWNRFLFDIGAVPAREPYKKRTSHGMILAKGGEKMSKSKGNVVNPDDMVEQYGADTLRTYIMFMGPFDQAVEWDPQSLVGVHRFLERVWTTSERVSNEAPCPKNIIRQEHQSIKKVGEEIEVMRFNTAVAHLMTFSNTLYKLEKVPRGAYKTLLVLLSPFAPHVCEELWAMLGHKSSITEEKWPAFDSALLEEETFELVIQVNGKIRDKYIVSFGITEEALRAEVLKRPKVEAVLNGAKPQQFRYISGKLVSIVA
ncbi:MAG: leucine--tRNA ligase [Candidatus Magasanikbacteria bacterium]|nr:leucine--tRNA ligase [Candidatus Magasanikbacteria bacterium]